MVDRHPLTQDENTDLEASSISMSIDFKYYLWLV